MNRHYYWDYWAALLLCAILPALGGCATAPATTTQPVINVQPNEQEAAANTYHMRVAVSGKDSVATTDETASLDKQAEGTSGEPVVITRALRDKDGNPILVDGKPVMETVTVSGGVRDIVMGNAMVQVDVSVAPAGQADQGQTGGQSGSGAPSSTQTPTASTDTDVPVDPTPPTE